MASGNNETKHKHACIEDINQDTPTAISLSRARGEAMGARESQIVTPRRPGSTFRRQEEDTDDNSGLSLPSGRERRAIASRNGRTNQVRSREKRSDGQTHFTENERSAADFPQESPWGSSPRELELDYAMASRLEKEQTGAKNSGIQNPSQVFSKDKPALHEVDITAESSSSAEAPQPHDASVPLPPTLETRILPVEPGAVAVGGTDSRDEDEWTYEYTLSGGNTVPDTAHVQGNEPDVIQAELVSKENDRQQWLGELQATAPQAVVVEEEEKKPWKRRAIVAAILVTLAIVVAIVIVLTRNRDPRSEDSSSPTTTNPPATAPPTASPTAPPSLAPTPGWTQLVNLDGDGQLEHFGRSVALSHSGTILAVGAILSDQNGGDSGRVSVYQNDGQQWIQLGQNITGDAAGDILGIQVGLSAEGTILATSAIGSDPTGNLSGVVKIYRFDDNSWIQMGTNINGTEAKDEFGRSLSLSSDGMRFVAGGTRSRFRAFQFDGFDWAKLGGDIEVEAGDSGSISGDGTIVAFGIAQRASRGTGYVRTFQFNGSSWVRHGSDIIGDAGTDEFGTSTSLSEDGLTLAVGATQRTEPVGTGYVRVFTFNRTDWERKGETLRGKAALDDFGRSISCSLSCNVVAVGANRDSARDFPGYVAVYHYFDNSGWVQLGTDIVGQRNNDEFGNSVSLSKNGTVVAGGAPEFLFQDDPGTFFPPGYVGVFEVE